MILKFFTPPRPTPDEAARQAKLDATGALLRRGDPGFDSLVREAADAFQTPMAAISLIDHDRQYFVAGVGLGDQTETPRAVSFCAHAIHGDESFVIPNATEDERFAGNPLVTDDPNVRFYAGAPIITEDGHKLGAVCVIDNKPRGALTDAEKAQLETFARHASRIIERREGAKG
jgi:GAF domain-containing protein